MMIYMTRKVDFKFESNYNFKRKIYFKRWLISLLKVNAWHFY